MIFSRVIEMDLLIALSTSAAYIFSVVSVGYLVAGQPLSTGESFEASTLLVTLIMVGRYVAALARQKAVESISVRSLQAATAILVEDGGDKEIDTRPLQYGDVFKVLPDSKILTDGTVLSGSSEVDEPMVTGESRPVEKYVKSIVVAGSVNGAGTLTVRLDRLPRENTISAIAKMVDEAKLLKPVLQDIADRVASYFVSVVVALTAITFCAWVGVGVWVQDKTGSEAVIQAITYAITVLIVSCPCAIGLAVPMVVVVASGVAAERGVVIKDATTIEVARKTTHVVLDKTGTLTEGRLTVASQVLLGEKWSTEQSQPLMLALLAGNKHPVSAAVAAHLREKGLLPSPSVSEVKVLMARAWKPRPNPISSYAPGTRGGSTCLTMPKSSPFFRGATQPSASPSTALSWGFLASRTRSGPTPCPLLPSYRSAASPFTSSRATMTPPCAPRPVGSASPTRTCDPAVPRPTSKPTSKLSRTGGLLGRRSKRRCSFAATAPTTRWRWRRRRSGCT